MAHLRHSLVGDAVYGGLKLPKGASAELTETLHAFRRQALHAEKLEFAHPVSGETISVAVEAPADMQALIVALRVDAATHAEAEARRGRR
jgi:23S rRNA pseudouridine1911/1915/1917 synthase